jgi:Tol biopolymer transport system component
VWRAIDTKLNREVAVKILPEAFVGDPDRRARFHREAQVLASLSHPNIAAIYGLEDNSPPVALIMELVDGVPLSEKIRSRGIPMEQTLQWAIQIAAGLEGAHKVGVVHRDLKPSNIMVTSNGVVKLLDFGLAKLVDAHGLQEDETQTIGSTPQTKAGCIVGTAAYMSPEQARGKAVDARSDIFSFGIVLFEMLTGKRPFEGEDNLSMMASILRDEPKRPSELASLPLPREVDRVVLRCLSKDPDLRFQSITDLRMALGDISEDLGQHQVHAGTSAPRRAPLAIIALVVAASLGGLWFAMRSQPAPVNSPRQVTFEAGIAQGPALSPDGKLLAYVSDRGSEGEMNIWLKQVVGGIPLRVTSGPGSKTFLQFSADGTRIFYLSDGDLFEVPALGGPSRRVRSQVGSSFAMSSRGDVVCYRPQTANAPSPIIILPAGDGPPETWHPECRTIAVPVWSPDADRLAFWGDCTGRSDFQKANVFVAPRHGGSVKAIAGSEGRIAGGRIAWFVPSQGSEAVVLPLRSADSINLFRIGLDGTRVPVTVGAGSEKMPTLSRTGELAFSRSDDTPQVWSVPLDDLAQKPFKEAAPAQGFAISKDGSKLVFGRMLGPIRGELVMRDRSTGAESVLASHELVAEGAGSLWPQISPGGTQIVYRAYDTTFATYAISTEGGAPHVLVPTTKLHLGSDWSPDGRRIIGECSPLVEGICATDPSSGATNPLLKDAKGGYLLYPTFSWDGKWVTFMLRRDRGTIVCATPVRADGTLAGETEWVRISPEAEQATRPHFSPDGNSIFYAIARKTAMEVVSQKLDSLTKKPLGQPAKIASAPFSGPGQFIISVSRDRLFFNTDEIRSNIWMARLD